MHPRVAWLAKPEPVELSPSSPQSRTSEQSWRVTGSQGRWLWLHPSRGVGYAIGTNEKIHTLACRCESVD